MKKLEKYHEKRQWYSVSETTLIREVLKFSASLFKYPVNAYHGLTYSKPSFGAIHAYTFDPLVVPDDNCVKWL